MPLSKGEINSVLRTIRNIKNLFCVVIFSPYKKSHFKKCYLRTAFLGIAEPGAFPFAMDIDFWLGFLKQLPN